MRKAPIQNTSSPDEKKEPETTLKLTEEVKSETEDKPFNRRRKKIIYLIIIPKIFKIFWTYNKKS